MSQATSKLWSRRMTSRLQEIPILPPLYSTLPSLPMGSPCPDTSISHHNRPWPPPSSPSLYTPTEAVGILLGQSPTEAAQSTRLAIEAATTATTLHIATPYGWSSRPHSSPSTPAVDCNHLPEVAAGEAWGAYLLRSLSHHQDDLHLEIDTAALATEVALHVLMPDYDHAKARKMRLIPVSTSCCPSPSPNNGSIHVPPQDSTGQDSQSDDKPMRKGRARMSQEKRKRLARRKEREAMLLGIPPKPVSAPPHMTHFPSLLSNQGRRSDLAWKMDSPPQWCSRGDQPSVRHNEINRARPGSASGSLSSQTSNSSTPSLLDDQDTQTASTEVSPNTSPDCARCTHSPSVQGGQKDIWTRNAPKQPLPRVSLQPPSPQQDNERRGQPARLPGACPVIRWPSVQGAIKDYRGPLRPLSYQALPDKQRRAV